MNKKTEKEKRYVSKKMHHRKKSIKWAFRLYVAGKNTRSMTAFINLKRICEEYLDNTCTIKVIDLQENPQSAKDDQILAIPTLVRTLPEPMRKIIGDLSNIERVLVVLDIKRDKMYRTLLIGEKM